MPTPSELEQEAVDTVRAYLAAWSAPGPGAVEAALAFLADGASLVGTGRGEHYVGRDAIAALFARERADLPDAPAAFEVPWADARLLRPDVALVDCQVWSRVVVGGETHTVEPRVSAVLVREGGRWQIAHAHFSTPDAMHEEGDTLRAALERRAHALEREVAERTAELEASLAELKAAQARLVQTEKMASLGALTAGIAHEIKNPLNFVTNFASLSQELLDDLADEGDPDEREALLGDLRLNVEKIEAHGRRADGIVRSMMAHARSRPGELRPVDVNALVEEYAGHALHAARARYPGAAPHVVLALADDAGEAEMAPAEIGRVLINLVDNALAAVRPDGGTVTVSTHRTPDAVEIRVADDGPGMAEAVRTRVFEPFYTTKPPGEGTGLGLSLSHDIVAQGHGGALTVASAEGEGATFTVRLPTA